MWKNQTLFGRDVVAQSWGSYVVRSPERGWLFAAFEDAATLGFDESWKNCDVLTITDFEGCQAALEIMQFDCGDIEETPQVDKLRERYKLALS